MCWAVQPGEEAGKESLRIRQLQKPKARSIRYGASNRSVRGLPRTEGPLSFSPSPLPPTSCGGAVFCLPGWVPELAV